MAPKRPAAAKSAPATKPKANTKAKITKPSPPATKKDTTVKGKLTAVTKVNGTTRSRPAKAAANATTTNASIKTEKTKSKTAAPSVSSTGATKNTSTATATAPKSTNKKRKAEDDLEAPPAKKSAAKPRSTNKKPTTKAAKPKETAAPAKKQKILTKGPIINQAPTQPLNVYVFGEGSAGELGLGTAKQAMDVKRPRLNPNLLADKVGVVQVSAGGMHVAALTHDNKILTWGVNDQGALGRDTEWDGGLRDADAPEDSDSDDDDDTGLNPRESTPGEVDFSSTELAEGTRWVEVAAGDSFTLALTDDGKVYGFGTFRSNEGILGFTPDVHIAARPVLIPGLKDITSVKAGSNHALALTNKGAVFAWGSGQQNQLGRRVVERRQKDSLSPREFGLPKGPKNGIKAIETGAYHSFAINKNGDVLAWGLNSFGQAGVLENAGKDEGTVLKPSIIEPLAGKNVTSIKGANHHSLASTSDGKCYTWGRFDGGMLGITNEHVASLPKEAREMDAHGKPRMVMAPQAVGNITGKVVHVTGASEHNIVVTDEGKAWAWGFSTNYQTGLGTTDTVNVPTLIDNTAVREKKLTGSGAGGQFGILTCSADASV